MPDEPERADPNDSIDTVPPPRGAKDAYSAQTRVGTLPEHVLAAMREQEASDAAVVSRNRPSSGSQAATTSSFKVLHPIVSVLMNRGPRIVSVLINPSQARGARRAQPIGSPLDRLSL